MTYRDYRWVSNLMTTYGYGSQWIVPVKWDCEYTDLEFGPIPRWIRIWVRFKSQSWMVGMDSYIFILKTDQNLW